MNTILNRLDRLMMAITFAEANEPTLAQECINSKRPARTNRSQHDATHMAGNRIMSSQSAH